MNKLGLGIIGCGNISPIYFKAPQTFENVQIVAAADLSVERAIARAAEFDVPRACSVEDLLADDRVELVVNLTVPKVHSEISEAAIRARKHVYSEKPLAIKRTHGQRMLESAGQAGVRIGCAPDTFLGGGLQTCRKLIDDGAIGAPVAATAFMLCRGHESWHPDPAFYYESGGGPLFDMGPYYLTALISLLGPIVRVTGSSRITFADRTIESTPKKGEKIMVETPTHIAGVLDFACGVIATLVTSFDVYPGDVPRLEIYGSEGTLSLPDPNTFGGPVRLRKAREKEWTDIPLTHAYETNSRGIGMADMAAAITDNRKHRASGSMAFHVLDVMCGILDAARSGQSYAPVSTVERPEPLSAMQVDL